MKNVIIIGTLMCTSGLLFVQLPPESNDLILQLRKRGIDKVILAGMSANLCVEAHMRELLETGFEVSVVTNATAAAILPDMNAYEAALINFRMMASHLYSTDEVLAELDNAKAEN